MEANAPLHLSDLPVDYLFELFDYVLSVGYRWLQSFYCTSRLSLEGKSAYIKRSVPLVKLYLRRLLGDEYEPLALFMSHYGYRPYLLRISYPSVVGGAFIGLYFLIPTVSNYSHLPFTSMSLFNDDLCDFFRTCSYLDRMRVITSSLLIEVDEAVYDSVDKGHLRGLQYSDGVKALLSGFVEWTKTMGHFFVRRSDYFWKRFLYLQLLNHLLSGGTLLRVTMTPDSSRSDEDRYVRTVVNAITTRLYLTGDYGLILVNLGCVFRYDGLCEIRNHRTGPYIIDAMLDPASTSIPHVPIYRVDEDTLDRLMRFIWAK